MKKVKIGIVGCGSITKHRHAPEYAQHPQVEIVGYYDTHPERAAMMAEKHGGIVYASFEDLLADKEIDAVSICTPNRFHAPQSIAALQAGKHVLCEKPMATTAEDARNMIAAAEKAHKFLMIGHNQRLADAHVKAKKILESGELGKVLTFRTFFTHGGPESWSIEGKNTWFFEKKDAVLGTMGDLGVHKADLIRWLLGDEIVAASAFVETLDKTDIDGKLISVDDNAVCILKSRSGIPGTLTAGWTAYGEGTNATILTCTKGTMRIYDDENYQIIVSLRTGEKTLYKVGRIQTNDNQFGSGVINAFVASILEKKAPEISGEEGLKALKIVLACMESAKTGMTVTV